jgi:hypothetical protein
MHGLLQRADFATTLLYYVVKDAKPPRGEIRACRDAADPAVRVGLLKGGGYALSAFGHRLDFYHRLPYGWRETPKGKFTDEYMCQQFLAETSCRAVSGSQVTILYFNRGAHPGWPVAQRLEELQVWSKLMQNNPDWIDALRHKAFWDVMHLEHTRQIFRPIPPILSIRMRGMSVTEYLRYQWNKRLAPFRK